MALIVVGLNHKGAPLDLLERLTFHEDELPKALAIARTYDDVDEVAILSTCNRTEVYAATPSHDRGVRALRSFLSDFHAIEKEVFEDRSYGLAQQEAAAHLFGVASGIDSMVVGEPQIFTQVRRAFRIAQAERSTGPELSAVFRRAIHVGRRARAETDIARSAATLANAAATAARRIIGPLAGRTVLIVGAGKMSGVTAGALAREGAHVVVANRTHARAHEVAARAGGTALDFDDLGAGIAVADVVITSTGSPEPIITVETLGARGGRPVVIVDIAVPRDVDAAVGALEDVHLLDIDDLRPLLVPNEAQRTEIERVRDIIASETERFAAWQRSRALAPLLEALAERGEKIRGRELARAAEVLDGLDDDQRLAVERLSRGIVAELLKDPLAAVRRAAGTAEGDALAAALRRLYGLPDDQEE